MNGMFAFGAEHQETVEDSIQPVQCLDDGPQSWQYTHVGRVRHTSLLTAAAG